MFTVEDLSAIPFPKQKDLYQDDWPFSVYDEAQRLPQCAKYFIEGDLLQILAIVEEANRKIVVANQLNCIGLLRYVLSEILFRGFSWNTVSDCLGLSDWFWFHQTIEMEYTYIEELPAWCREVWQILIDRQFVVQYRKPKGEKITYLVYESLDENNYKNVLIDVYQDILPVFFRQIELWVSNANDEGPGDYDSDEEKAKISQIINDRIKQLEK